MVLKKIGEYLTTINVNGTERVSQLQDSDKTYNISEIFNTDIIINGNNEGSFNQSEDSTYDIDVSDVQEFNISREVNLNDTRGTFSGSFSNGGWYHLILDINGLNSNGKIYINGNQVLSAFDDYGGDETMININSGDTWEAELDGGGSSPDTLDFYADRVTNETVVNYPTGTSVHIPTGVNVDSVNKQ